MTIPFADYIPLWLSNFPNFSTEIISVILGILITFLTIFFAGIPSFFFVFLGVFIGPIKPTKHPEQYILRFSDDIPALALYQIERNYKLEYDNKSNLWTAIAKNLT